MLVIQQAGERAVVAVAEGDLDVLRPAAETLIEYVEKSTGVRLALETAASGSADVHIHLGLSPYTAARIPGLADMDEDGFAIETVGEQHLIIAGPTPSGTEYGVCAFLERVVGVRWLLPGEYGEYVPQRQRLVIPALNIREEPVFLSRSQPGLGSPQQRLWGRRQRLSERFKGAGHNVQNLFSPARYARSHPHFFPLLDGRRYTDPKGWDWHPCFTAAGLAEEAAATIVEYFRLHPEEQSYSIGISDGAVHCQCADCQAAEQGRRNWLGMRHVSEQYFCWANRVAELVVEAYPDKWLGCLAYANIFDPPVQVQVHPRIIVFHTYDRHKWIHPQLERAGHELARAWQEACANMAWYDYTFGGGFMAPRLYLRKMGEVYRYAAGLQLKGITAESVHNWAEGPKFYLLAKLQWNPYLDVDEVLSDWYQCAVGAAAAPYLASYCAYWEDIWTGRILDSGAFSLRAQQWLPLHDDSYFDILGQADFAHSRQLLEQVVARAGKGTQAKRAQVLWRGFACYEAAARARLADIEAAGSKLDSPDQALRLIDQMPAAVAAAAEYGGLRRARDADPVLGNAVPQFWPGLNSWGWGAYPLWRALFWIEGDSRVRERVEALAGGQGEAGAHARRLLDIVECRFAPLAALAEEINGQIVPATVDDTTLLTKEPGERMAMGSWQFTIGDDVEAFWNGPHPGRGGQMRYESGGGRTGGGAIVCRGVEYGTIRRKLAPIEGVVTALCFVRVPAGTTCGGRVVLNLWPICWSDHNPSPFRISVQPQPGVWTPLALSALLQIYGQRRPDYLLCEWAVENFGLCQRLEISDLTLWAHGSAD